jgi:hypothetical protein
MSVQNPFIDCICTQHSALSTQHSALSTLLYVTVRKGGFIQLIFGKQISRLNPPLQSITNYRFDT